MKPGAALDGMGAEDEEERRDERDICSAPYWTVVRTVPRIY